MDLIHSREDILGILYPENSICARNDEMENRSPSDGNVCSSNFDHMSYTECPTESDENIPVYEIEMIELKTETGEFNYERFMQLFTNTSHVYMHKKRIFENISFHDCNPQMKLDICICFVECVAPALKDVKWMRELKQLSFALSGSDEDPDFHYAKIDDCFKKLSLPLRIKQFLIDGLFGMIIKDTPYSKKIKSEEKQKSKKQSGKNKGKKKK